jgi:hypothetical protein
MIKSGSFCFLDIDNITNFLRDFTPKSCPFIHSIDSSYVPAKIFPLLLVFFAPARTGWLRSHVPVLRWSYE